MGESKLKYGLRVLKSTRASKVLNCVNEAHKFLGESKLTCAMDIVHCMRKFSGYYDYVSSSSGMKPMQRGHLSHKIQRSLYLR